MRALALIQGVIVILGVLIFSGLDITWVFGVAIMIFVVIDFILMGHLFFGKDDNSVIDRIIRWVNGENTKQK